MSATATCLSAPSWRRNAAKDETPLDRRTKIDQSPTRRWTGSRESPERQTRSSTSESRRVRGRAVVAGERTREQRMQARPARLEMLNKICGGWEDECRANRAERGGLYYQVKVHTNHFETWLVEMVYPGGVNMPDCIKPETPETANHPKYKMPVNNFITLADALIRSKKQADIPTTKLSLLDEIINERSAYSHFLAHPRVTTPTDGSREEYENHQHFIDVMEDVKTILSRASQARLDASQTPPAVKSTNTAIQRQNSTLGKRKTSLTSLSGTEQLKAVKTAPTSTLTAPTQQRPMHVLRNDNKPITSTMKMESGGIDKTCAAAAKPTMSWAAVACAGIAA